MSCTVGITDDIELAISNWVDIYPALKNWNIIIEHNSKADALIIRNQKKMNHKCTTHPECENNGKGKWYVYHFEY